MPELDSIRGLAILAVLFYHGLYWKVDLSPFSPFARVVLNTFRLGRLGVSLFFVLSGFLITGLLLDSRDRPDYYWRFYVRRALRILPAYLLTIVVLASLRYAPAAFLVMSLAYLSNLTPLFGVPIAYPILWSLAVEEHFYFLWPVLTRKLGEKGLAVLSILVVCLSPVSRLIGFWNLHGVNNFVFHEYTWNSADGLACGALLAIFLRRYRCSRRSLVLLSVILCLIAAAIWIVGFPSGILTRQTAVGASLQIVPCHFVFVALIVVFLLLGVGKWKFLVHTPVLKVFGDISYGLYLCHLLVFEGVGWLWKIGPFRPLHANALGSLVIRFIVAATLAVLIALLSRRQFENRFLRLKSRLT